MNCKTISLFIILMQLFFTAAFTQITLPKILGHNMVLQRNEPVPIWGMATAGEVITVSFGSQIKTTTTGVDGKWKIFLDAMPASFLQQTLKISSSTDVIELKNILVGEVWLCSGQSNMEFAMRKLVKLHPPTGANWPVNEVAEAKNENLRIFLVERKKMNPDTTNEGWSAAIEPGLKNFSAVGYFFGKRIYEKLNVPVGIISAAIPGSRIEPWMPLEGFADISFFKNADGSVKKMEGDVGKFYESMIAPLVPFALKGFLWYQGESNCFLNERLSYAYKMKALIQYWRKVWSDDKLPFYYVQIAPYFYSKATDRQYTVYSEPEFWEVQSAVLKVPNTAIVATVDLNDDPADLHPVNKWDVGKRLANSALSKTYKVNNSEPMGPVFKSAVRRKNYFVIDFAYKGKGLKTVDGKPLNSFEIADASGNYYPGKAIIKRNKIRVTAANVHLPIAVRFAWREDARPNLINSDGLPAFPFRTNNSVVEKFN
ncbi:MAG: sialate O-acetylesterase [Niabella sp.]